jgi:hypothetical protein
VWQSERWACQHALYWCQQEQGVLSIGLDLGAAARGLRQPDVSIASGRGQDKVS